MSYPGKREIFERFAKRHIKLPALSSRLSSQLLSSALIIDKDAEEETERDVGWEEEEEEQGEEGGGCDGGGRRRIDG